LLILYDVGMLSSEAVTRNVRVRVRARFDPERSNIVAHQWFFQYTVDISNEGTEPIQLISRHWIITNAVGEVQEVKGLGVVGQQPVIGPGQRFEYTSGCGFTTPSGSMRGTYQMISRSQGEFDVDIAPFEMSGPYGTIH
jgi:ApaG protein